MATTEKRVKALPPPTKSKTQSDTLDVSAKKKKKKRIEDEADEPKKKKRTELVEYEEEQPKLSLNKTKMLLKTQFGKGANKILNLIEREETDPAIALLYKRLLQSVVDILPWAELGIRKSKGTRGTYQYVQLISTLRELMVDIQSAQDRGMMGTMIVQQTVRPAFGDLAQDTVLEYATIASDAKGLMSPEEYEKFANLLRESRGRLANRMTHHYRKIDEGIVSYLQR